MTCSARSALSAAACSTVMTPPPWKHQHLVNDALKPLLTRPADIVVAQRKQPGRHNDA